MWKIAHIVTQVVMLTGILLLTLVPLILLWRGEYTANQLATIALGVLGLGVLLHLFLYALRLPTE